MKLFYEEFMYLRSGIIVLIVSLIPIVFVSIKNFRNGNMFSGGLGIAILWLYPAALFVLHLASGYGNIESSVLKVLAVIGLVILSWLCIAPMTLIAINDYNSEGIRIFKPYLPFFLAQPVVYILGFFVINHWKVVLIGIGVIVLIFIVVFLIKYLIKGIKKIIKNKKIRKISEFDKVYTLSGKKEKRRKFKMKNGAKDGEEKVYYKSGKINKEQFWQNGSLNGKATTYYPSGDIYITANYVNNKLNGDYTIYSQNGSIREVRKYINGEREV